MLVSKEGTDVFVTFTPPTIQKKSALKAMFDSYQYSFISERGIARDGIWTFREIRGR